MKIQESAQDYLECILVLSQEQQYVRATDICRYFGYARATVSVFLKQLKENGFVEIDEHNHVSLTEEGAQIAQDMLDRHEYLTSFFEKIGVSKEIAAKDACRVEHYISTETYDALKKYLESVI